MKSTLLIIRITAILFYSWLYIYQNFDLLSCVLGAFIMLAVTTTNKKKSEAPTSDS